MAVWPAAKRRSSKWGCGTAKGSFVGAGKRRQSDGLEHITWRFAFSWRKCILYFIYSFILLVFFWFLFILRATTRCMQDVIVSRCKHKINKQWQRQNLCQHIRQIYCVLFRKLWTSLQHATNAIHSTNYYIYNLLLCIEHSFSTYYGCILWWKVAPPLLSTLVLRRFQMWQMHTGTRSLRPEWWLYMLFSMFMWHEHEYT